MDYLEILSFCGYDVEAAGKMVRDVNPCTPDVIEEALKEIGLEKIQPKSN